MPQLQTFSLRGRSRLAQQNGQRGAAKRREYDTDGGTSSDTEDEHTSRRSRKKKASLTSAPAVVPPQYTVFPAYPAPVNQHVYRRRKKTSLAAAKPAETRLASANNDSFFTVNLNLFTLLAIIGIVIMIVVMFNLKNQVAGLENKMQVMLLTTM